MTLPLLQNIRNFETHLRIGFHTDENSSKVTKRSITLNKETLCLKNQKGALKNPITHPTHSGVTSSTISTIYAKGLINPLQVESKFFTFYKVSLTAKGQL